VFGVLFALQFKALHRAPVTHLAWLAGRDTMPQLLSADSSGRVVLTTPATTASPAVHTRLDQVAPLAALHKTHQVCTQFGTLLTLLLLLLLWWWLLLLLFILEAGAGRND